MIGSGSRAAIRTLPQRRFGGVKLGGAVRDIVGRFHARRPGVVILKLPRRDQPISRYAATNLDDAGWAEVAPGEFFLAGPDELHGFPRGFRETRRLDGGLAGVFAAVRRAGVGHDHANKIFANSESFR